MIISYGNRLAKGLVEENNSKELRRFPAELRRSARKKLLMIHVAQKVLDLRVPPGNRLEKLKGDRAQEYSIRINDQWRITFKFEAGNASNVCVEDYHS